MIEVVKIKLFINQDNKIQNYLMGSQQTTLQKQQYNLVQRNPLISQEIVPQASRLLLIRVIEKDDLVQCAIVMQEQNIKTNNEISQQGLLWLPIHFCCRWNSAKCLEYILKEYYARQPRNYMNLVNLTTSDGLSCLHLCAIWNSKLCFSILTYYGGLTLTTRDKLFKTAQQTAQDYSRKQMAQTLSKYRSLNIIFIQIQHDKLVDGSILDLNSSSKQYKVQISAIPLRLVGSVLEHIDQEERIKKQRQRLGKLKQQLTKQKLQIEKIQKNKMKQILNKENNQQDIQKLDRQMEIQRQKKLSEFQKIQEQMNQLHLNLNKIKKQKLSQKIQKQNEKLQTQIIKSLGKMSERLKQKDQIIKAKKRQNSEQIMIQRSKISANPTQQLIQKGNSQPKGTIPEQFRKLYAEIGEKKFIDFNFPPELSSIGKKDHQKFNQISQSLAWMRPSEIFKSDYKLFDGIEPNDIKQGQLGVCYYLATLSALAAYPQYIKSMFQFADQNLGFYILRFYVNGRPKFIVIDDLIPCSKSMKQPLFTQPNGKEVWVMLLQKCWAKIIGNYLSAQGMTPHHMMEDLTGAPGYGSYISKSPNEMINEIIIRQSQNQPIVLTSQNVKQIEGIINNHAYSLLKIYKHQQTYLFKIRNPWGHFEWNGKYGESSPIWTEELKKKVGFVAKNDGVFFLSKEQLIEAFCYFSVSLVRPKFIYSFIELTEVNQSQEDHFYSFQLKKDSQVNLRVIQPFKRIVEDSIYKESPLIFNFGRIQSDGRVTYLFQGELKTVFGAKSLHFSKNIIQKLTKGKYFVRVQVYWLNPSKYRSAVLAAYSQEQVIFSPMSKQEGFKYWKELMVSFSSKSNLKKYQNINYQTIWMKGQLIYYVTTDSSQKCDVIFRFDPKKFNNLKSGIGISKNELLVTVQKNKPGIGTFSKIILSNSGSTGPFQILIRK